MSNQQDPVWLAARFEENRGHLRSVAYRMLGSLSEAEDAVQESWIRLARSDTREVENLGAWLTTVIARVCLDMLRSRKSRREEAVGAQVPERVVPRDSTVDPQQEAVIADSVGLALLVVLEHLAPAERIAFVLHDLFAVPFDEIAAIVGRTPDATRQLASRARRRVQGADMVPAPDLALQRRMVNAFLTAARGGDMSALLTILDPEVVLRADRVGERPPMELRGAAEVAGNSIKAGARAARPAMIDGEAGVVVAPGGHLLLILKFTWRDGKIAAIDAVADPDRLSVHDIALLGDDDAAGVTSEA
jgi:RNA polymerase sigma factor (sigma-70 family)